MQVEKILCLLSPATNLPPEKASEGAGEALLGPPSLHSPEVSPVQETPLCNTLEHSAADCASQKHGMYGMSACLETKTPQKLSLALLPMCQHRHRYHISVSPACAEPDVPPVQSHLEAKRHDVSKWDVNTSSE